MGETDGRLIREGREALRGGDGAHARRAFEAAATEHQTGEVLEGLAEAVYLEVDYKAATDLYERAFAAYRREGDLLGAARAARTLAWIHGGVFGDEAVQSGWLARARRLLSEASEDSAERGWVALWQALAEPDLETKQQGLREAVAAGRRFGDPDLEFEALAYLAATEFFADRVEEGMVLLDESLAALCAGEVNDISVIEGIFCGMFMICERAHDVARAEQWIRAAHDVVRRRNLVAVAGFCRVHYGGILTAAGRWDEAETELTEAARILERGYRAWRGNAIVRLADLRIRQGRLEEAAQLLDGLDQHPDAARPLAVLDLARGDTDVARDRLERALASDPASSAAGPVLALLVDVHLAEGSLEEAERAAERLTEIAARQPGVYLKAAAALARGQVCVASGTGDARGCLHEAVAGFARAQMPIELARARLELARAVSEERPAVAVAEAKAALHTFERLEAARHADAAAALLRSLGAPSPPGPKGGEGLTKREAEVLELLGHGLSNPEISDRLYISRKTVEHHVGRILSKLGLRSRAEAAAYAARTAGERSGAK